MSNILSNANSYWKKKGVIYESPSFKSKKKTEFDVTKDMYDKYKDAPYVGFYRSGKPRILLRDPEIIKDIFVKDFDKFVSRGIKSQQNDVLSENILFVDGKKWKLLRHKLTPTFTSGKLKSMIPLIFQYNSQLCERLEQLIDDSDSALPPTTALIQRKNLRMTIADYTTSVMTSVAFGIESGTLYRENKYTPFNEIGRSFFENNKKNHWFYKYFNTSRFRVEDNKFITIFKDVIKDREQTPRIRHDFIDLCLNLKRESILSDPDSVGDFTIKVTDEILAAQAFFFFLAGNDSAETVISFAAYELAHNQPCLFRLHNEIDNLLRIFGKPTYECLQQAEYLDRVIKETMRKYPPIGHLQRVCNSIYTLPDGITIEPGIKCTVSVLALHRDEKFYPEPSKFDPDRFLKRELENANYYMPFGKGPRQCIGIRLGMMQVKMALFAMLTHFTPKSDKVYQNYLELQDIFVAVKPKNIGDVRFVRRQ